MRRLPKRKWRRARDGACETCSICLEEFKEGETVRVLPCDHGNSHCHSCISVLCMFMESCGCVHQPLPPPLSLSSSIAMKAIDMYYVHVQCI